MLHSLHHDTRLSNYEELEPSSPPPLLMRNHWAKAVHGTLLVRLGLAGAREFWERHPLQLDGRMLSLGELSEHIWQEKAASPLSWTMGLVTDLERFLLEHGVDFRTFLADTRRFANHGTFVHPRHLLSWLGPILVPMFRFGHPYRLLLHGARLVSSEMSPGVVFTLPIWRGVSLGGSAVELRQNTGSVWLTYPGLPEGEIAAWDFAMQPGEGMLAAPTIFGLPPFSALDPICDARSAQSVPWDATCELRDERFYIDGVEFGHRARLGEFLEQAGYALPKGAERDTAVTVIDRDFVCPKRGRAVLLAGCAYGASGYLCRLSWRNARVQLRNFLSLAHAEVDGVENGAECEALQVRYLESVREVLSVRYFVADDSVQVGAKHVCRGMPARILHECVRVACHEGRNEFTFRELKRLPTLISHPKNTGLEIRLQRLRQALEAADCGVRIEPAGRGRIRLVSQARLLLETIEV